MTMMMVNLSGRDFRDVVRVVLLCLVWYAVSSTNGVVGKWILSEFAYPMTLSMAQLLSVAVYSGPMLYLLNVRKTGHTAGLSHVPWKYYASVILPLALAKFASNVFSHLSIWKVPVSYAHTVKASMPLFTIGFSRVLFGEGHTTKVYLSLLPILAGVALATVTEVSFDASGLVFALLSTCGFSLMNIFSKKVLKDTGIHHLQLLCTLGRVSCAMFLPFWALSEMSSVARFVSDENRVTSNILLLLLVDGILHFLQNILAFTILKLVAPLTYAVANVTKRISIVTVSLLLLKNHVTGANVVGMLLAIFGVFYYNVVKFEENKASGKKSLLPMNNHDNNNKGHHQPSLNNVLFMKSNYYGSSSSSNYTFSKTPATLLYSNGNGFQGGHDHRLMASDHFHR